MIFITIIFLVFVSSISIISSHTASEIKFSSTQTLQQKINDNTFGSTPPAQSFGVTFGHNLNEVVVTIKSGVQNTLFNALQVANGLCPSSSTVANLASLPLVYHLASGITLSSGGTLQDKINANSFCFSWSIGRWGGCDASACGSGTQTRIVQCQRSDGVIVADNYCSGTKPITSQSCADVCLYYWSCGNWVTQSNGNICTKGTATRTCSCYGKGSSTIIVADSYCNPGDKPVTSSTTYCSFRTIANLGCHTVIDSCPAEGAICSTNGYILYCGKEPTCGAFTSQEYKMKCEFHIR